MSNKKCNFAVEKDITKEDNFAIQLFEGNKVRIVWDEDYIRPIEDAPSQELPFVENKDE